MNQHGVSDRNSEFRYESFLTYKNNTFTHAAATPRNLDATIPLRSADTELHSEIKVRAVATAITALTRRQDRRTRVCKSTKLTKILQLLDVFGPF